MAADDVVKFLKSINIKKELGKTPWDDRGNLII
jgi:hypothetical protein